MIKIEWTNFRNEDLKCCGNCKNKQCDLMREYCYIQGELGRNSYCYCEKWEYDKMKKAERKIG